MLHTKRIDNVSATTGVSYDKRRVQWKAKLQVKGNTYYLGRYATLELAIAARKAAEILHNHKN